MGPLGAFVEKVRLALGRPAGPPSIQLDTADIIRLYGDPGTGTADPSWERANIVDCHGDETGARRRPAMPGVPSGLWFRCHRLVEPAMRRALAAADEAGGGYVITRAASYVFRHQRHDPHRPLSRHSWGIAVDINPVQNAARQFPAGRTPALWSEAWLDQWPRGLPRAFVEAFEAEGFVWGGRWRGFVDPMHMEYTAREP
jgi:hypothetical protein